jgi:hypothetical protein
MHGALYEMGIEKYKPFGTLPGVFSTFILNAFFNLGIK